MLHRPFDTQREQPAAEAASTGSDDFDDGDAQRLIAEAGRTLQTLTSDLEAAHLRSHH